MLSGCPAETILYPSNGTGRFQIGGFTLSPNMFLYMTHINIPNRKYEYLYVLPHILGATVRFIIVLEWFFITKMKSVENGTRIAFYW